MRTLRSVSGLMVNIVLAVSISTLFLVHTLCGLLLALLRSVAERVGRGEISMASAEIGQGLGHVNGAVAALEHMRQQNAALVEESAAAAASLKHQATSLTQVVAAFKLEPA
jgi:hypothetical protein